MSYRLVDVELTGPPPDLALGEHERGVALVSRDRGRVVGFALHALRPGTVLSGAEVAGLLDPDPWPAADPAPMAPQQRPTITVVICTRDRPELLALALEGLARQRTAPDEIVVVDNGAAERTREVVERFDGVRWVAEPCPGLDFARNKGLQAAEGDHVAFLDDDAVPDAGWIEALHATLAEHPDLAAWTGQILPAELETASQIAFEQGGGFRGGNGQVRYHGQDRPDDPVYPYGPGMFGAGCNMAVRRDVALSLGGFDEALDTGPPLPGGGDIDMFHRVIRAGLPLIYEPRGVVFHRHRRDADGLLRQYDSWGRSLMAFVTKTYVIDPAGRPKLRRLLRWWFATQGQTAIRPSHEPWRRRAAAAEVRGAIGGLLGTYGRSRRRSARLRRTAGEPTVAILPWGDVVEDYLTPLGLSVDDYADRLSGGWLFGYADALREAGMRTVIVCWSTEVRRPMRRMHVPSGAVLWVLPPSRAYRAARARLANPYALNDAAARAPGVSPVAATVARVCAPYLTTTPWRFVRILRREGCVGIVPQEYEEGRFDLCVALGRVLGIPVVPSFQGGNHTRTWLERRIRRYAVRAASALIIADEREVARTLGRYDLAPERVARIPNPLDPAMVTVTPQHEAREALGLPAHGSVVAWVGRVDIDPKGIDVLLDAWAILRRATPDLDPVLLLLGTGSGAPWLHEQLAARDLGGVVWRDEYVLDRAVVNRHLSAADVFVLPSRQEGFPVALVEAMAAGLPVVACDAPGARAILGDVDAGVVVPREDSEAVAAELEAFLRDPERRRAAAVAGRVRATSRFSPHAVGTALRQVLLR